MGFCNLFILHIRFTLNEIYEINLNTILFFLYNLGALLPDRVGVAFVYRNSNILIFLVFSVAFLIAGLKNPMKKLLEYLE